MSEGRKNDNGKLRYDLEPQDARAGMVAVLTDGAVEYGVRNWEQGMDWSRCYAAAQRHLAAWWGGEDTDPQTGRSHMDHAMCCVAFLSAYEKRGVGTDDRPVLSKDVHSKHPLGDQGGGECRSYEIPQARAIMGSQFPKKFGCDKCRAEWRDGETKPCERNPDIGIPTSEQNQSDSEEGWIDHDGSDRCPVTDGEIRLDTRGVEGFAGSFNFHACPAAGIDWPGVKCWRVAEVDGWVRNAGHLSMPPVGPGQRVKAVYRGGSVLRGLHYANNLTWDHKGARSDIIAYRVEKDGA